MLVLSRKRLERICIGEKIWITVVKVERNAVRLGIEAPDGVTILREELLTFADPEPGPADSERPANRHLAAAC